MSVVVLVLVRVVFVVVSVWVLVLVLVVVEVGVEVGVWIWGCEVEEYKMMTERELIKWIRAKLIEDPYFSIGPIEEHFEGTLMCINCIETGDIWDIEITVHPREEQ